MGPGLHTAQFNIQGRGYLVLVVALPAVLDSPSFLTMKLGSASLSLQHEELF